MTNVNYSRDYVIEKLGGRSLKNVNDFLNKGSLSEVGEFPTN